MLWLANFREAAVLDLGNLSDVELVEHAASAPRGDTRAFEVLVSRYQQRVLTNCRCITGSADDAPDLAQEVFVKIFFGLNRFEGRSQVSTWVNRIKINHCFNFLRRQEGKLHISTDDPDAPPSPEPSVEARAERDLLSQAERSRVQQVVDALPGTLRVPLVLREYDGFSYQEIAEELGIGLSAVKMRIKRAREEFRRRFEEHETDTTAL